MTESVQLALIVTGLPTVTSIVLAVLARRDSNRKAEAVSVALAENTKKTEEVHGAVNGRMTDALAKIAALETLVRRQVAQHAADTGDTTVLGESHDAAQEESPPPGA